jgi:protein ImuA
MSRHFRLQQLLKHPRIWKQGTATAASASAAAHAGRTILPTGFAMLDEWLGGGWTAGVLTELLLCEEGGGELSLLMPALRQQSLPDDSINEGSIKEGPIESPIEERSWIAWIAPPHIPYPPALMQQGLDTSRLLVIHPDETRDALWAMEQTMRSTACGAVLAWLDRADDRSMRRLQLAAEHGQCWAVIFRPAQFAGTASPAPLRIRIRPGASGLELEFLRNRYGRTGLLRLAC